MLMFKHNCFLKNIIKNKKYYHVIQHDKKCINIFKDIKEFFWNIQAVTARTTDIHGIEIEQK